MMGGTGAMMGWGWLFGALMIVGIVLLMVLVVRLAAGGTNRPRTGGRNGGPDTGVGSARRILDERYARGELDTEEYRERLQALREDT